jgi:hypothetical protein
VAAGEAKRPGDAKTGMEPTADSDTEFKIDIKFTLRNWISGKSQNAAFSSVSKKARRAVLAKPFIDSLNDGEISAP